MLRKPLTVVAGLFGLDYLLWLWSSAESHDTTALVAGLLLVLLAVSLVWLLVKEAARAVTSGRLRARRARPVTGAAHEGRRRRTRRPARRRVRHAGAVTAQGAGVARPEDHEPPAAGGPSSPPRRRLAA